jgi:hypothetical protein
MLAGIAEARGIRPASRATRASVDADYVEAQRRGVKGSPDFSIADRDYFGPALSIERRNNEIVITPDTERFDAFMTACLV